MGGELVDGPSTSHSKSTRPCTHAADTCDHRGNRSNQPPTWQPQRPFLYAHIAKLGTFSRSSFRFSFAPCIAREIAVLPPAKRIKNQAVRPGEPVDPARCPRRRVLDAISPLGRRLVGSKHTGPLTRKHRQPGHIHLVFVRRILAHDGRYICVGSCLRKPLASGLRRRPFPPGPGQV